MRQHAPLFRMQMDIRCKGVWLTDRAVEPPMRVKKRRHLRARALPETLGISKLVRAEVNSLIVLAVCVWMRTSSWPCKAIQNTALSSCK